MSLINDNEIKVTLDLIEQSTASFVWPIRIESELTDIAERLMRTDQNGTFHVVKMQGHPLAAARKKRFGIDSFKCCTQSCCSRGKELSVLNLVAEMSPETVSDIAQKLLGQRSTWGKDQNFVNCRKASGKDSDDT